MESQRSPFASLTHSIHLSPSLILQEKGTQLVNEEGGVVASFPVGGPENSVQISGTSEYEILRGDLSKLLYESTKDLPTVEYRFSTTVDEVVSNDQDSVKVKFSDGQVESFDVLIAGENFWSEVAETIAAERQR